MNTRIDVEFKILRPVLRNYGLPQYATVGSAGMDLCACVDQPVTLQPGATHFFPAGFALHMKNTGLAAMILSRSGLGTKKGLVVKQGVGLIDSDYQGEITVAIHNIGSESQTIQPGDRIAQLVVLPVFQPALKEVSEFAELTERGAGGFGSTGLKAPQTSVSQPTLSS